MRKQLSLHLPFIDFKPTNDIPILRVLGEMLQFGTAMHPCCRLHPCPAAEHGSVTDSDAPAAEGRSLMSVAGCPQRVLGGDGKCACVCVVIYWLLSWSHRHNLWEDPQIASKC